MTIQPKRLTEIDRAEILAELEGTGFHELMRAHFLYEDIALAERKPAPVPQLFVKMGERWHQVRGTPANEAENYETVCGRFASRSTDTKLWVDANWPVPGELCLICKTEAAEARKSEKIIHPQHYNMGGAIGADGSAEYEVIKIIEDLGWGYPFCMGNALKYVLRAPHKGAEAEDLKKAQWYIERAQAHRGSIVARVFRRMTEVAVCQAWGMYEKGRLAYVVYAIMDGDPTSALANYKLYLKDKGQ